MNTQPTNTPPPANPASNQPAPAPATPPMPTQQSAPSAANQQPAPSPQATQPVARTGGRAQQPARPPANPAPVTTPSPQATQPVPAVNPQSVQAPQPPAVVIVQSTPPPADPAPASQPVPSPPAAQPAQRRSSTPSYLAYTIGGVMFFALVILILVTVALWPAKDEGKKGVADVETRSETVSMTVAEFDARLAAAKSEAVEAGKESAKEEAQAEAQAEVEKLLPGEVRVKTEDYNPRIHKPINDVSKMNGERRYVGKGDPVFAVSTKAISPAVKEGDKEKIYRNVYPVLAPDGSLLMVEFTPELSNGKNPYRLMVKGKEGYKSVWFAELN